MAKILSFSLSEEDAAQLQILEKRMDVGSRSELMRMALQSLKASQDELESKKGDTHAVLVLVDSKHGHAGRLDEIAHEYEGIIVSSMHQVLHHECVEMWLLHGAGERIVELDRTLRRQKGLSTVKTIVF